MNDGFLLIVLAFLAGGSLRPASPDTALRKQVTIVVDRKMRDAAMAVADPVRPVIYVNPTVLAELEPSFVTFVIRHEHGHIRSGHQRPDRARYDRDRADALLRSYELEADCIAAAELVADQPAAVDAAIRFFSGLGPVRVDSEHPSGEERAAVIRACAVSSQETLR